MAIVRDNSTIPGEWVPIDPDGRWPRSWTMKAMWPTVKLEVALTKRRWLPWNGIRRLPPPLGLIVRPWPEGPDRSNGIPILRLIRCVARFQRCATLPPLRYDKASIAFTVLLAD